MSGLWDNEGNSLVTARGFFNVSEISADGGSLGRCEYFRYSFERDETPTERYYSLDSGCDSLDKCFFIFNNAINGKSPFCVKSHGRGTFCYR